MEMLLKNQKDFITYHEDVTFMEKYIPIIMLSHTLGKGVVAVSPGLQGRVMTSSADGSEVIVTDG